jgi:hypothetical protein
VLRVPEEYLKLAIRAGHQVVLRGLLWQTLSPEARNTLVNAILVPRSGQTALTIALSSATKPGGSLKIAKLLLQAGASVGPKELNRALKSEAAGDIVLRHIYSHWGDSTEDIAELEKALWRASKSLSLQALFLTAGIVLFGWFPLPRALTMCTADVDNASVIVRLTELERVSGRVILPSVDNRMSSWPMSCP